MRVANSAIELRMEGFTLGYASEVIRTRGVYQALDRHAWHRRHKLCHCRPASIPYICEFKYEVHKIQQVHGPQSPKGLNVPRGFQGSKGKHGMQGPIFLTTNLARNHKHYNIYVRSWKLCLPQRELKIQYCIFVFILH